MSTYPAIEAAVLAAIRTIAGYDETNTSRSDYAVLDSPTAAACVVEAGAASVSGELVDGIGHHGALTERHIIRATAIRAVGTGETGIAAQAAALRDDAEAIAAALRADGTLDVLTWHWRVSSLDPLLERRLAPAAAPTHLLQPITLTCWCVTEEAL